MKHSARFADTNDIEDFKDLALDFIDANSRFSLPDFSKINSERCPWNPDWNSLPQLYAPRLWEYPYAYHAADLEPGMSCVDVGAGLSPFTALISERVGGGKVTAIEPQENDHETAFGFKREYFENIGAELVISKMSSIPLPSEGFDRVFCISVLEHITDPAEWHRGLHEMVRILKPNGRLIITFDLGIERPFIHPLEILKVAGLPLLGGLDLNWPKQRLVDIEGAAIDVFGMTMVKSDHEIFSDPKGQDVLAQYKAFDKFDSIPISNGGKALLTDISRPFGRVKAVLKLLMNKYS